MTFSLVECLLLHAVYRDRVRIKFSVWLVSGYARVFILLSIPEAIQGHKCTKKFVHILADIWHITVI